jgi:hypothetical protein
MEAGRLLVMLEMIETLEVNCGKLPVRLEIGCPTWTRTRNQVINSHLLYH